MMSTLYVTEPGVQVHKEGQRLIVKKGQEILQDIPIIKIDRVILMGKGVSITTPTLFALSQRKVGVFYLSSGGKFMGRWVGDEHRHSRLRLAQFRAADNPARCLDIARSIVRGKVHNQRVLVQRHAEGAAWAQTALNQMDNVRQQIEAASSIDELRGFEGLAARNYFSLFRRLLHPPVGTRQWEFERRIYYPPTDPINAMLSFGYTLLLHDLTAACQISGLDPDIGFFHSVDYNKPSLALDLEEEFRSVIVDSIILTAVNRRFVSPHDFEYSPVKGRFGNVDDSESDSAPGSAPPTRAIYMKEEARKKLISMYEARVAEAIYYMPAGEHTSYRRVFELQTYALSRTLLGETPHYQAFTVR